MMLFLRMIVQLKVNEGLKKNKEIKWGFKAERGSQDCIHHAVSAHGDSQAASLPLTWMTPDTLDWKCVCLSPFQ